MTRVERREAEDGTGLRTYFRLPGVGDVMAAVLGAVLVVAAAEVGAADDVLASIAAVAFESGAVAALADGGSASVVSSCVEDVTASD